MKALEFQTKIQSIHIQEKTDKDNDVFWKTMATKQFFKDYSDDDSPLSVVCQNICREL